MISIREKEDAQLTGCNARKIIAQILGEGRIAAKVSVHLHMTISPLSFNMFIHTLHVKKCVFCLF
jgi:hypothetical protein